MKWLTQIVSLHRRSVYKVHIYHSVRISDVTKQARLQEVAGLLNIAKEL